MPLTHEGVPVRRDSGSYWSDSKCPRRPLVVDGGYELVYPRFMWTVIDKDVQPALLLNLDPRRKDFQATDAWTSLTSD